MLTVMALGTWRLTYDFVALDGPLGLYRWLRDRVSASSAPAWVKEGIACGYCVSFWVGFALCLLIPGLSWSEYILYALASSGAVTLLARYLKSMYGADLFE